jgi:hypothetical protein
MKILKEFERTVGFSLSVLFHQIDAGADGGGFCRISRRFMGGFQPFEPKEIERGFYIDKIRLAFILRAVVSNVN